MPPAPSLVEKISSFPQRCRRISVLLVRGRQAPLPLRKLRASTASDRSVESSFTRRTAGRTYKRADSSARTFAATGRECQRLVKQAAVAPLPRWQAIKGHELRAVQSPLFVVGRGVESIAGQRSRGWRGSVAGAHNKQLERTVMPQHVRAASVSRLLSTRGAHDTSSRRR